jgi:hypothetical protein
MEVALGATPQQIALTVSVELPNYGMDRSAASEFLIELRASHAAPGHPNRWASL